MRARLVQEVLLFLRFGIQLPAAGLSLFSQAGWRAWNGGTTQPQMSASRQILSELRDLVSVILTEARKAFSLV